MHRRGGHVATEVAAEGASTAKGAATAVRKGEDTSRGKGAATAVRKKRYCIVFPAISYRSEG